MPNAFHKAVDYNKVCFSKYQNIIMITIFTPTYNRAYTLLRLYKSIQEQSNMNFEWLIVDDGSTDNTESLVKEWQDAAQFTLRYYKQKNGGKHRAINLAMELAKGDLFFIVDSDDYLPSHAIDLLNFNFNQIKDDESFCGVSGSRCYPDGNRIGGDVNYQVLETDSVSFRQKYKVKGDMAEAWRLSVLRKYPFPEFAGEKFVTEAFVWNEIAKKYKLRYFNNGIYICEYLDDGLTKHIRRHHRNSPQGTMSFYASLMIDTRFGLKQHLFAAINYWRYTINYKGKRKSLPLWAYLFYPFGYLIFRSDINKERK